MTDTTREPRTARHEAVKTVIFNAWTKGRIKFYSHDDGSEEDFLADEILDVLDEAEAAPDAALREALERLDSDRVALWARQPNNERWAGWVEGYDAARRVIRAALTPPAEEKP